MQKEPYSLYYYIHNPKITDPIPYSCKILESIEKEPLLTVEAYQKRIYWVEQQIPKICYSAPYESEEKEIKEIG